MATLCLDCFVLVGELAWTSPESLPSVSLLVEGVCPVCHGTKPLDLNAMEPWAGAD